MKYEHQNGSQKKVYEGRIERLALGDSAETQIRALVVDELTQVFYAPTDISLLIGRSPEYISAIGKKGVKTLESWKRNGFSGWQTTIKIPGQRGEFNAIASPDFRIIVESEGTGKGANVKAASLLSASFGTRVIEVERILLGLPPLKEVEKQATFSQEFAYALSRQSDLDDLAAIEEQEAFLQLNLSSFRENFDDQPKYLWDGNKLVEPDWSSLKKTLVVK